MSRPKPAAAPADAVAIGDVVADPANRRSHSDRNLGMIVQALKDVGAARSIVVDEDLTCLAGNGVLQAAAEAGLSHVRIIEATGDELIAIRRRGLTDEQKRALAIYDNRAGELAAWNAEQFAADRAAGLTFDPWFTEAELTAIIGNFTPATEGEQGDLDGETMLECPECGHRFPKPKTW